MRIYLDNCCFNRPYDNQDSETVHLETEAKLFVQDQIRKGDIELVWSFILDYENSENPFDDQRESIGEWEKLSCDTIQLTDEIAQEARTMSSDFGIGGKDALHLSAALAGKCRFFLTTDRKFLKKSQKITGIETVNPIVFTAIMEGFDEK